MTDSPDIQRLQLAVERVRAEALDMRGTGDLRRVVAVMFREMLDLGIDSPGVSIHFLDEVADEVHHVVGLRDPRSMGVDWSPDRSEREVVVEKDAIAIGGGFLDIPGLEFGGTSLKFARRGGISAWREKIGELVDWDAASSAYEEDIQPGGWFERGLSSLGLNEEQARLMSEGMRGRWYVTNVRYRFGMVGYRERQHDPAHDTIVAELARGLELGFVRFLDFQKLEQRNRDLEVEQALERLRTGVAQMQTSDDLTGLRDQLQSELQSLGVPCRTLGLNTYDPQLREFSFRLKGQATRSLPLEASAAVPSFQRWVDHWEQGTTFVRRIEPEDQEADLIAAVAAGLLTEAQAQATRDSETLVNHWVVDTFFDRGSLGINKPGESFSEDDIVLLERFTEVFALGYRRYLDLADAEDRARQAEIERAVETVRAAVEAMRRSSDLNHLSAVVHAEARALGVPIRHAAINIIDETARSFTAYGAELRDGVSAAQLHGERRVSLGADNDSPAADPIEPEYVNRWRSGGHWQRLWDLGMNRRLLQMLADLDVQLAPDALGFLEEQERWVVDVFFAQGALVFDRPAPDPFSDADVEILERLTAVFAVGYRRHLELADAEDRARQAELERGVERVRAAAMAMQSTDGLPDVVGTIYREAVQLGLDLPAIGINFVHEDRGLIEMWNVGPVQGVFSAISETFAGWELFEVGGDLRCAREEVSAEGGNEPIVDAWRSGETTIVERDYTGQEEARRQGLRAMGISDPAIDRFLEVFDGAWHVYNVPFTYGAVGCHSREASPWIQQVLEALSGALELGYLRFLDFQKLEQHNRELVVEQALERLRTGVAAMESSQDVTGLADQLGEEVRSLGVPFDGLAINQFDPVERLWTPTHSEATTRMGKPFPVDLLAMMREWAAHWECRETWVRYVDSTGWRESHEELLASGWIPPENIEEVSAKLEQDEQDRWVVDSFFEHGGLAMHRLGSEPFAEEDVRLLERFTEVFATGFRRHLDLKDAEDRARRAEIELGVERVRAASMGMNSSEDLPNVVAALTREMRRLGVSKGAGINFIEKDGERIDVWNALGSDPGPGLRYRHGTSVIEIDDELRCHHFHAHPGQRSGDGTSWQSVIDVWRSREPLTTDTSWTDEDAQRWVRSVAEGSDEAIRARARGLVGPVRFVNVPFSYGTIGYHQPRRDDHIEIVQALAGALELGYLRYFDLQAAEQRAREAEIERSLERVRTAIAGMQDAVGLLTLVRTVADEFSNLGIQDLIGLGINTIDPTTGHVILRDLFDKDPVAFEVPEEEEPNFDVDNWRRQLQAGATWHRRYPFRGDVTHLDEAVRKGGMTEARRNELLSKLDGQDNWIIDAFFDQGSLALRRLGEPFADDEVALLQRFTAVFSLGYRRHLDLVEAEQRSRQADIDLSVERVRAASMAMDSSEDLPRVVGALAHEMHRLSICSQSVGINFIREPADAIDVWNAHPRHPAPGLVRGDGEPIEGDDSLILSHIESSPSDSAAEGVTWRAVIDAWRSGNPQISDGTWTREGVERWAGRSLQGPDEAVSKFVDEVVGPVRFANVPFTYGAIGYSQPQRDDHIEIVQALAGALELGYLRYFDLQAAEQRARDAEQARARQHVRSVVTSMKTADDIGEVVVVLRDELRELGVPCDQVGINIADEEAGTIEGSWSSALGDDGVDRGGAHGKTESSARLMQIWKSGDIWSRPRSDNDPGAVGWVVDVAFDFGTLAMNRGQTDADASEFSAGEIAVLQSFAEVISLGYTRFRDFEQLETQNRRLAIEGALQRLRAEVASMGESDDIARVMGTVFSEMRGVGVPAISTNVIVVDREERFARQYALIPRALYEERFIGTPDIENVVEGVHLFRGDRPLRDEDDWIDTPGPRLIALEWTPEQFEETRTQYREQFGFDVTGDPFLTQQIRMPFSHGVLLFFAGHEGAFDESHLEIAEEFARMLSLGYSRYLDFETLEAQYTRLEEANRRLATERAVERVRAEATGLTSSEDAWRVIAALWEGLTDAGLEFTTCGIQIVDEERGQLSVNPAITREMTRRWMVDTPAHDKLSRADIVDGVDLYHTRVDLAWARDLGWATPDVEASVTTAPEGFGDILRTTWGGGNFGPELDGLSVLNVPFSHGGVVIFAPVGGSFTQTDLEIASAFADAVSLGYTRFVDLQQLEERNRELVIERAVERVRAEAAAMSKPEDLGKLFVALWEGADEVGCPRPGMNIADEERQEFYVYGTWSDDEVHLAELANGVQVLLRDFVPGTHLIRSNAVTLSLAREQGWAVPGMTSHVVPMADDFPQAMQMLWGYYNPEWEDVVGVPVINVPFAYGGLFGFGSAAPNTEGITQSDPGLPTEEDLRLFERFASAVGYGYGRYLELVAAEERNRQLRLDRAVERVRAEATGMRQSSDFGKLLLALRQSWADVGLHTEVLGINVIDEDAGVLRTYNMAPRVWPELEKFIIGEIASDAYLYRFRDLPLSTAHALGIALPGGRAGLMTKDAEHVVLLRHLLGIDFDELPEDVDGTPGIRIPFRYGGIWAWADRDAVLDEDHIETGSLFADAVALGYTRFLDLQAAEDNARQQAIEAAVERVRGAALGMQSTDDLPKVAGVLHQQLDELAPGSFGITVSYLDKDRDECIGLTCTENPHQYDLELTVDVCEIDEERAAFMASHPADSEAGADIRARCRALWDHGEPEWRDHDREALDPILSRIFERWFADPDQARRSGFLRAAWETSQWHGVYVPFTSGMVGLQMPVRDDNAVPILQELTEALDLGFVRFLDFKSLEEQNRRQAIENAAERVRAAAMSMASPDDLRDVAGMLFTELRALGIQTPRVTISFHDPRSGEWLAYHTNINPRRFGLDWTAPGIYEYSDDVFSYARAMDEAHRRHVEDDRWSSGEPSTRSVTHTLEVLVDYAHRQYGIDREGLGTNPYLTEEWVGDWEVTSIPFNYGVLDYYERQHDKDGIAVVQELLDALNLGFVRFLDFQRLEEQVTRLEEAHKALELANEQIQQANRLKSEFLANMSHELRTPMNAIVGFSKLIHRKAAEQLDRRQTDNLERVMQSAEHLMTLINEILDLSKIEAGRLELQNEHFDLRELIESCIELIKPQLKTGVKLRTRMARNLAPVWCDPARMRQVVTNLLSNAVKFTESGQITVGLRARGDQILIDVTDSGIGIADDKLDTIFEEFRQADGSTTRKYGGTGLGLSISRRLAQMFGGDLTVTSVVGEGSTFTVSLPRTERTSQPGAHDADGPSVRTDGDGRIVLSIDDDPDVISLISQELEEEGYRVIGAERALEGIAKAQDIQPHAITLDIMMPGMDGWEAISRLKANPETRDIPIIVVSIVDNKELGYRLGADEYLIKPVDRESLGRVLQRYEGRGKQVLVTDDDPVVIELTRQLLEEDGWTVRAAGNGQEALDALADEMPDVMLLDLMMPVMDGFETLRRLRDNPDTANLPVVIITAKDLAADETAELRANASRVIEKDGLDKERILRELREAMRTVRSESGG